MFVNILTLRERGLQLFIEETSSIKTSRDRTLAFWNNSKTDNHTFFFPHLVHNVQDVKRDTVHAVLRGHGDLEKQTRRLCAARGLQHNQQNHVFTSTDPDPSFLLDVGAERRLLAEGCIERVF